jgi:rod shape-determining protein MreC
VTRRIQELKRYLDYIVLIACVSISIYLITLNDEKEVRLQFLRSTYLDISASLEESLDIIDNYIDLETENDSLKVEIERFRHDNLKYKNSYLELIKLKKNLNLQIRDSLNYIYAEVVSYNKSTNNKSVIINKGKSDSIHLNDAVIFKNSVIGKISFSSARYSIVQLAIDPLFEMSVRIQRLGVIGSIIWDGYSRFHLRYISKNKDVKIGDVVISSGLSETFPANLKVGIVESVNSNIPGLYQDIIVIPSTDFSELQYVNIIRRDSLSTRDKVIFNYEQ